MYTRSSAAISALKKPAQRILIDAGQRLKTPPSPVRVSLNIRDCELMMGFHAPFIRLDVRLSPGLALGFSIAT
jgi:hypothetical protein